MLSGYCVCCQQPVEMLRLMSPNVADNRARPLLDMAASNSNSELLLMHWEDGTVTAIRTVSKGEDGSPYCHLAVHVTYR